MKLKIFTLIFIALIFSSCESRSNKDALFCQNNNTAGMCDYDGDGYSNDVELKLDSDQKNPCLPKQDDNYSGYDSNNPIWSNADCDDDGYSNGEENNNGDILSSPYDGDDSCFIFKDLKYCETRLEDVLWLDRNLGAIETCDGDFDKVACFGDYYQWGRMTDGHETLNSETISNQEKELDGKFSVYNLSTNQDWNIFSDKNGEERAALWAEDNKGLLCPNGWAVPSIESFLNISNEALNIPDAGYKAGQNALLQDDQTGFWSSSVKTDKTTSSLFFTNNSISHIERANALPIRCIKLQ